MKPTTNIWIAFRNIGDSQDQGSDFNGTVSESILWMATKISKISMAGRFVVGMGRTQEDALRGIDVKNAGKSAVNEDMKAMLDSVFADVDDSEEESTKPAAQTQPAKIAGDDYVA